MDMHRIEAIATSVRRALEMIDSKDLPWPSFPRGACGDTSLVLGQVLHDTGITGFDYICGNKYKDDGSCSSHAWLRRDGLIVDITADQFSDVDVPVIVARNSGWHDQWEQDRPTPGTLEAYGAQVPQLWRLLSQLKPRLAL